MEICIRENYIDTTALKRFEREELKGEPYNFAFAEVPDDITDCAYEDFDSTTSGYKFNRAKYDARKQKRLRLESIPGLQQELDELKQDIEQTELFGISRAFYGKEETTSLASAKQRAAEIVQLLACIKYGRQM